MVFFHNPAVNSENKLRTKWGFLLYFYYLLFLTIFGYRATPFGRATKISRRISWPKMGSYQYQSTHAGFMDIPLKFHRRVKKREKRRWWREIASKVQDFWRWAGSRGVNRAVRAYAYGTSMQTRAHFGEMERSLT